MRVRWNSAVKLYCRTPSNPSNPWNPFQRFLHPLKKVNYFEWNIFEWKYFEWNIFEWKYFKWKYFEWKYFEWKYFEWKHFPWKYFEWKYFKWNFFKCNDYKWNYFEWKNNNYVCSLTLLEYVSPLVSRELGTYYSPGCEFTKLLRQIRKIFCNFNVLLRSSYS